MTIPAVPVDTRLVIGPNASLSGRQALVFFAGVGGPCLLIAGIFASVGLWPVLPFAGLELAALGLALLVVLKRNRYREVLTFEGAQVRVEIGLAGGGARALCEWPRRETRVWLEPGAREGAPTRLVLAYGASRMTLGACLTDAERASLAARLKELIHPAGTPGRVMAGTRAAPGGLNRNWES